MTVAVITGSAGLIGSESAKYFSNLGFDIVGIDNDMRAKFFGPEASVAWQKAELEKLLGAAYRHFDFDIRSSEQVDKLFSHYRGDISLVLHTAAQPSHDWAAHDPKTDFGINATGTLNVLEATRRYAPDAVFIFTSTNKVYGDQANSLPLIEDETRWEIEQDHAYWQGVREDMSIDGCLHSLFGASKVAADVLVQEYGRYFDLKTACFRGGCLTGPNHSAAQLHGFLAYLMKCAMTGSPYTIFGYKGKQVRDNIHSHDLILAFDEFRKAPHAGEVYNIGGGRDSNCSMLEAIELCQEITGQPLAWTYSEQNRIGDHIWWISNLGKFQGHYPHWTIQRDIKSILIEIYENNRHRWSVKAQHDR